MILQKIADRTRERVRELMVVKPLEKVMAEATAMDPDTGYPFEEALKVPGISFICEVKRASPSKGIIAHDFDHLAIAMEYEKAGAAAISVLTEPFWFMGSDEYLRDIAKKVGIPVLRKDFTISSYQIYEGKVLGASAVLLICSLLDEMTLSEYIGIAHSLGLSALVEVHDEKEVRSAVKAGARVIGVNNRDLKTFEVDIDTSVRLRKLVPPGIVFVSESGIRTREDIEMLEDIGTDAVLIGETLMRSPDKKTELQKLKGMKI
jgi:indole-3-glycerol phosphate synthase